MDATDTAGKGGRLTSASELLKPAKVALTHQSGLVRWWLIDRRPGVARRTAQVLRPSRQSGARKQ
eukprot:1140661-Prymnesium_polylepis.1